MKILFLHGWQSVPGGLKPTCLREHGCEVINPALPDDQFEASVRIAEAEYNQRMFEACEQMGATDDSILDHPAVSGRYLFPQARYVDDPFMVKVDGAELACYRRIVDPENFTVVHFHGNGEAVSDYLPDMADVFAGFGLNSLFVEYREYGGSTGQARLVAMLGDGETAIKAAGLPPEKTIVFGRSIGSLYAIELVHRQGAIAGLILESGIADPSERFLTYADLSAAGIAENDVLAETKRRFNHKRKLSGYKNPLLIMHTDGSLYKLVAAKRGFLKPIGEWNKQEVVADKNYIKITLNGEVILEDADLSRFKRPDMGHIGFLGHGSKVQFRNIEIKELSSP